MFLFLLQFVAGWLSSPVSPVSIHPVQAPTPPLQQRLHRTGEWGDRSRSTTSNRRPARSDVRAAALLLHLQSASRALISFLLWEALGGQERN